MTPNPASHCPSILKDGELKPGIYKIQNIYTETFLDIHVHSREVCCRPAKDLGEGRGLWEIKRFGGGYTVQVVEPGKPEQFCAVMGGPLKGSPLSVTAFPVAWRVEIANDDEHRGFEFIRFYWGTTKWAWDLAGGSNTNGNKVTIWSNAETRRPWRIWKLIPVKVEGALKPSQQLSETLSSGSLPPYDGGAIGQSSTHAQHTESERDDFGTIVTEVTILTTRNRYRVEEA